MLLTSYTQFCFISAIIAHLQDDWPYTNLAVQMVRVKMKFFLFRLTGVYEYLLCTNTYGN